MASEFYEGYLIASRPKHDFNVWIPYAVISWRQRGELQFQNFPGLKTLSFPTESQALSFGFLTARTWVDGVGSRVQRVYLEGENFPFHKVLTPRKQKPA